MKDGKRPKWVPRKPHPLESIVRAAFALCATQDRASLVSHLSGGRLFRPPSSRSEQREGAWYRVAAELLDVMLAQGKIYQDPQGWFRLSDGAPS